MVRLSTAERMLLRYLVDVRLSPPTPAQCVGLGRVLPGTASEAEHELGLLVQAGLVCHDDGRYQATCAGVAALRSAAA